MSGLSIINALIVPMTEERNSFHGFVRVTDGVITEASAGQIVHCVKASDVQTVIVNGEILMRDRRLTRLDDKKILAEAGGANRDLMERLNRLSF
jgi:hypothetical protein